MNPYLCKYLSPYNLLLAGTLVLYNRDTFSRLLTETEVYRFRYASPCILQHFRSWESSLLDPNENLSHIWDDPYAKPAVPMFKIELWLACEKRPDQPKETWPILAGYVVITAIIYMSSFKTQLLL